MTGTLARIWRHPIKAHGAEALERTAVREGCTLPLDRAWAVRHEAATAEGDAWAPCVNFSRGAKAPSLMAIDASWDEATGRLTLDHPDRPALSFDPDADGDALIEWTAPLVPSGRAAPEKLVRAGGRGMTDTEYPSISLAGLSSLRALSDKAGRSLDQRRFRANFWVDGLGPWEEFEWVGRSLAIGSVAFRVEERITRCRATMADPETGRRDVDTLAALEDGWGHRDFGIYLVAESTGEVAVGDPVTAS